MILVNLATRERNVCVMSNVHETKEREKTNTKTNLRRPRSESAHPKSVCSFILITWDAPFEKKCFFPFLYTIRSRLLHPPCSRWRSKPDAPTCAPVLFFCYTTLVFHFGNVSRHFVFTFQSVEEFCPFFDFLHHQFILPPFYFCNFISSTTPPPPPCPSFLLICIDVHTKRSLVFKRKGLEVLKLSKSSGILSLSTQLSSVFLLLRFVLIFLHNVRENPQKVSNLVKWFLSSLSNTCIAAVFNLPRKKFFICSFFFFLRLIRQRENTKL